MDCKFHFNHAICSHTGWREWVHSCQRRSSANLRSIQALLRLRPGPCFDKSCKPTGRYACAFCHPEILLPSTQTLHTCAQAISILSKSKVSALCARAQMHLRVGHMAASPLQAVQVKPAIRTDHCSRDHAEHVTRHTFLTWLLGVGLPLVPIEKYASEQPAMSFKLGAVKCS